MKNDADLSLDCWPGCPQPLLCPLSKVRAGSQVRIKGLKASAEMSHRLRELGFCEDQPLRLLSGDSNFICQVCNMRLGISRKLAEAIWVEPISPQPGA